jgi:hypothetical protein
VDSGEIGLSLAIRRQAALDFTHDFGTVYIRVTASTIFEQYLLHAKILFPVYIGIFLYSAQLFSQFFAVIEINQSGNHDSLRLG